MNNNELQHYGVPGMKWGKRKSPNSKDDSSKNKMSRGKKAAVAALAVFGAATVYDVVKNREIYKMGFECTKAYIGLSLSEMLKK